MRRSRSRGENGAERARIKAILDAPQAAGKAGLARHLALNTDLAPEAAAAILEAAASEAQAGGLDAAMASDDSDLGPAPEAPARGRAMADVISARFG